MTDPFNSNQRDPGQIFGQVGKTVIDFGAFPGSPDVTLSIADQIGIHSNAYVEAHIVAIDTTDHSADEHLVDPPEIRVGSVVSGVGFTIYGKAREYTGTDGVNGSRVPFNNAGNSRVYGQWSVQWRWLS